MFLNTTGLWFEASPDGPATRLVHPAPTPAVVAEVERRLGVQLPRDYVELATTSQNGGYLARTAHPAPTATTWASDHVAVDHILAIGHEGQSLCGDLGHAFWVEEWGYPDLGVYFAGCPSGGHDMVALDYRSCGPQGEPSVVHVDQEWDYAVTPLASCFGDFINGLVREDFYDE